MTAKPEMDKKILEKIKLTLNLANAKDDHESHTALLLAQQMMAKYGLEMEDIENVNTSIPKEIMEMYVTKPMKLQWWQKRLSGVIADNFKCFTYYRSVGGRSRILFLGLKEDTKIAREVYLYAQDSIEILSISYLDSEGIAGMTKRAALRNDYIAGFISGLRDKFKDQVETNNWGLILVKDDALVERHTAMKITKGTESTASRTYDSNAMSVGYDDGQKMNHLNKVLKA